MSESHRLEQFSQWKNNFISLNILFCLTLLHIVVIGQSLRSTTIQVQGLACIAFNSLVLSRILYVQMNLSGIYFIFDQKLGFVVGSLGSVEFICCLSDF